MHIKLLNQAPVKETENASVCFAGVTDWSVIITNIFGLQLIMQVQEHA